MRKKVLSVALSMMMIVASLTPAFGAEFSSGEEIETISEECKKTDQEAVFSEQSGNKSSEDVFDFETENYSDNEKEELSKPEELTDVFQPDDEFTNEELLQTTTEMNTAEETKADKVYSENEIGPTEMESDVENMYGVSGQQEMTDKDYIQEILERQGALPQLSEIEDKKAETAAALYKEYGNQKTFMQFIPKKTGRYNIKLYQKNDKYQNSVGELLIYDLNFDRVQNPFTLKQGCIYYITNAYAYMDLSNCIFMTEYVPAITSLKVLEEPENKVLYKNCGVTPLASEGWLAGIKLEVVYDNGKKEIISTDNGIKPKTSYGEYLVGRFDGEKPLYELVAGKYTFTIYPMYDASKSVKINNIEVKEKKDLPLYTTTGSISVNTTWEGSAYIRFKPQETGKYVISSSSKGEITVQKENLDFLILSEKSTVEVMLEAGKSYYISSGIQTDGFVWGRKLTFTIKKAAKPDLSKCKITVSSSVSYTGKALTPAVTIKDGTVTLKKGTDYTLSCSNNTKIGTATVTIKGKGNYTGIVKENFKIVLGTPKLGKVTSAGYNKLKITWNKVTGANGYIVYQKINGKWKKITTTQTNSYTHTNSKSFPVLTGTANIYTVKAYQKSGKTTLYSGYSKSGIEGKAALSKPTISKVSKTTKGIKLQWKTISGASGYVIQRYDSGKWVTKKTVTGSKTLTYTDTTAKKGKTYKYRIAAYRTVNKKKVLSPYSAVKSGKR